MAVRNDFTAGEVLAAADLNDTFASKVDYALPVNAQTGTTYTFVAADAEKLTTASNGSAVTLTIPPASSVAWPDNTVLRVVNYGAGAVTIDGGSGVTVTNTSSTIAQYGAAVAIRTGSDAWTVVPFGGGDVPSATVSSPAATGQYTDTGITYDYYTFTASGTLTVDTAGFADVLVVGGGGSGAGGNAFQAGGGAGGHFVGSNVYLPAGSLTVTVGAGGVATVPNSNEGQAGQNGVASSIGGIYFSPGGGGGGATSIRTTPTTASPGGQGLNGGSGGGASGWNTGSGQTSGSGISGLGNNGGSGADSGGGGGGAGAVGGNASGTTAGAGGAGASNSFTGSAVTRAGGGGGQGATGGAGGTGGGGAGSTGNGAGTAGTANTGGGGGGGAGSTNAGGNGGSGVVIVRVKV